MTGGKTLDPSNLINIVNGNSYVLVLAIGMVMVIIAGHIDLSVGSVAAFVGIIVAESMDKLALAVAGRDAARPRRRRAGRRLAGVLGRLRRRPRVHRDPGRHAVLPRRQPVRRQLDQRRRCPASSPSSAAATCPRSGRTPGYNNLDPAARPRSIAAAIVWQEWRLRRTQTAMDAEQGAALGERRQDRPAARRRRRRDAALRERPGRNQLPDRRHHPRRARARLLVRHEQHDHRPPHLRGRRQLASGRAVRREDPARQLLRHVEHVGHRGPRRHDVDRPLRTPPAPATASAGSSTRSRPSSSAARRSRAASARSSDRSSAVS